ncbi:MAG: histidine ammonia-lyase [Chloroflexota bacterium]
MLKLTGNNLTIENVVAVARKGEEVKLAPQAKEKMITSHRWVTNTLKGKKTVYGINTGFGIFSEKHIPAAEAQRLSRNLILSHAVGTGEYLPGEVVRAAMLIRANTLARGYSGVRPEIVETLLEMLNKGVTPLIPSQGSLGSSGDLSPLAHLALVFSKDEDDRGNDSGWAEFEGKKLDGKTAMSQAGIPRLILGPKEGLAITNGATFSAALAALALYDASILLDTAEVTLAMSLEALLGVSDAFDPRIHALRPHPGQQTVAARVRQLTQGSSLIDSTNRVQDAYSLRCAPQVQGAARDTLTFIRQLVEREINAVTDNPILLAENEAISGGNFHGEPVGFAMDFLSIVLTEVSAISERRTFRLIDGSLNQGLPPMLVDSPGAAGINSGMMMPQYTAAALVLENRTLSTPDSVQSLSTSGSQEDHNANSMTAARHAHRVVANTAHVLAIEAFTAARALDIRLRLIPEGRLGVGVKSAHAKIRSVVPYQGGDKWWGPDIDKVCELITAGDLI